VCVYLLCCILLRNKVYIVIRIGEFNSWNSKRNELNLSLLNSPSESEIGTNAPKDLGRPLTDFPAVLPRDAMHKRGLCRHAVSVRVCVCVSRLWILSKRINYPQNFYTIGEPNHSIFSTPNGMAIFLRGSPNGGVECRWGRQK